MDVSVDHPKLHTQRSRGFSVGEILAPAAPEPIGRVILWDCLALEYCFFQQSARTKRRSWNVRFNSEVSWKPRANVFQLDWGQTDIRGKVVGELVWSTDCYRLEIWNKCLDQYSLISEATNPRCDCEETSVTNNDCYERKRSFKSGLQNH